MRLNKLKPGSLEQRKVYCRAKQRERVACTQKPQTLQRFFWGGVVYRQYRVKAAGCVTFTSEGWKLHPPILLMPPPLSRHLMKKHVTWISCAEHQLLHLFPTPGRPPIPVPKATLLLYPINIPGPLPLGRRIRDLFCHLLTWLLCE